MQLAVQRVDLLRQQVEQYNATVTTRLSAVQDVLSTAASSLEWLTRLVNDLLDVSHLQADQLTGQPAPADLLTLVRTAVDEKRPLAPARHIQLHQSPSWGRSVCGPTPTTFTRC